MSLVRSSHRAKVDSNKILTEDRPVHDWYRFVLSYPPHLVRTYLKRFEIKVKHLVLDPFCGTGTTLVECKKQGVPSVGIEANPMAHYASQTKVNWALDPDQLIEHAQELADQALGELRRAGMEDDPFEISGNGLSANQLRTLSAEQQKLLLTNSISARPLHKTVVLRDVLTSCSRQEYQSHLKLALAKAIVFSISNLHFGPEVGVGPAKGDVPVLAVWLTEVRKMADDLRLVQGGAAVPTKVLAGDARAMASFLDLGSIDAVITSPPYPNEKDYTRTTRLESVLLGLIKSKADLRALKRNLVRSNTRGVYKIDNDDKWISGHKKIESIAHAIEARRIELGKTSGFERLYARVTRLYFGGMARHLADLRQLLRPGALLAYVVGDQASYLRIMIRTGQLLADIAASLGYEVIEIDLFRTRLATATKAQLREEVVVLRWPGSRS
jgi:hypothetical protein